MKTLEKIFSPKLVSILQTVLCFLLMIVLLWASLGTVFDLEVNLNENMISFIDKIFSSASEEKVVIPEKIEVSLPFILKSIGGAIGFIVSMVASLFGKTFEALGNVSQGAVDLICLIAAVISALQTNLVLGACYAFILYTVFAIPISCVINLFICLISILKNITNPGKAFHRIGKSFAKITHKLPLILLIVALVPDVKLGKGVVGIFAACLGGILISLIASRLKVYEKAELKYINLLQIFSLAAVGAFGVFYMNIGKANLIPSFIKGAADYGTAEVRNAFIELAFLALYVTALVIFFDYLTKSLTRLACMSSSKSDTHLFTVIVGLVVAVLPFVVNYMGFGISLSDEQLSAHIVCTVAIGIIFVLEIVFKILSTVLCRDVKSSQKKAIVTGAYIHEPKDEEDNEEVSERIEEVAENTEEVAENTEEVEESTEEVAEEVREALVEAADEGELDAEVAEEVAEEVTEEVVEEISEEITEE